MSLPNYGNVFPDDILGRLRDLEQAVNSLQGGTFAAIVTLAGDVTGLSSATVVGKLQGQTVSATIPSSGQVLQWDGSSWTPTTLSAGSGDLSKNVANAGVTTTTSLRSPSTGPTWRMERSLGTGASPTAITSGYTLGGFTFGGYDGTSWVSSAVAGVFGKTGEDWTSSAAGTFLTLETTATGSTSRTEALRVTAAGDLLATRGFPSFRPYGPFAYQHRAASLYLARADSEVVTELYLADSTGYQYSTAPETLSVAAVYEAEMARRFNKAPRTSGYMPVKQLQIASYDVIQWDTVAGTGIGRGANYTSRALSGTDVCKVRRYGTGVTVYYTAELSGGGYAVVNINGSDVDIINSTSGSTTYSDGKSVTYARPEGGYGPIDLTISFASGTRFILEGCAFHNQNESVGYRLLRGDRGGQSVSYINSNPDPLKQTLTNVQPQIVTIQLGHNDVNPSGDYGLSSTAFVDELTTLINTINGQYSTWKPAIRFVFQQQSDSKPTDWDSTYRLAIRNACLKLGVLFVDGNDAVGSTAGSDPLKFAQTATRPTESVHPNNNGHWVWGKMLADITSRPVGPTSPLSLSNSDWQQSTATSGITKIVHSSGPQLLLGRQPATSATANGDQLGGIGFAGSYSTTGALQTVASMTAVAEGDFTGGTDTRSGLRFYTQKTDTQIVRGGFTSEGTFFIGTTPTAGVTKFDVNGGTVNLPQAVTVTGGATIVPTGTFLALSSSGNVTASSTTALSTNVLYAINGKIIELMNVNTTGNITLPAGSSLSEEVFLTPSDAVQLRYSSTVGRWIPLRGTLAKALTVDGQYSQITGTSGLFGAEIYGTNPSLVLRRAQGTISSPTHPTANVGLGTLSFAGYNSADSTWYQGAQVRGIAEQAWSTAYYRGSRLEFLTAPSSGGSSDVVAVRAIIDNAGKFWIGATTASAVASIDQSGNASFSGHLTAEGVTSTGATGTGKFVFDNAPTITGHPTLEGVTATGATGTGKLVFDTSPTVSDLTVTGTLTAPGVGATNLSLDGTYNTITGLLGVFGAGAFGTQGTLLLRRAQGTSGSPTGITSGIGLGTFAFSGYNSADSTYYQGAQVRAISEQAFTTANYRGTRLEFLTAVNSSSAGVAVRAIIDNAGKFYVGATTGAANASIDQSGNATFGGTLTVTGHPTLEGVTATGATGTGKLVFDTSPALVTPDLGAATATSLTASAAQSGAVASVTQGTVGNPVMQLVSTATNDDPTEVVRQYRVQTTSNAATTLGSASLPASSTTMVRAYVIARTTAGGTANDGAGYILAAVFQNGVQIGSTVQTIVGENQAAWDATINYNANTWRIVVTGAASTTITWHGTVRIWSVGT